MICWVQVYGNNMEIQALSEMYNRPIHIYSYSTGIILSCAWLAVEMDTFHVVSNVFTLPLQNPSTFFMEAMVLIHHL